MSDHYKDAVGICKTVMRNGYDAYVVNARLQREILDEGQDVELDIATDIDFKGLDKLFPEIEHTNEPKVVAALRENGVLFRFYPIEAADGAYPEECVSRMTPRLLKRLEANSELPPSVACPYLPEAEDRYEGFKDLECGEVCLTGFPDDTLKRDYLRAVRAMRFAANYNLPIEKNTWLAIVRGSRRVLDYVSVTDLMDEWRKVEAENMYKFVRLLFDCQLLHGLIPEVAALSRVIQLRNENEEETVFDHTLRVMEFYPEERAYDWKGTLACMFHDVGKLYTGEYFEGQWHFYQHHRVGAQVTRKIMNRLRFDAEDIDLVCNLVRHHKRFSFMLTDKGIRRFMALSQHQRIVEMERAAVKARGGNYTEFNHNMKMMERTETPEEMLEPLLNGNEIMDFTGLHPGPSVGLIRESLLQAQVAGDVASVPDAVEYVIRYKEQESLV